MRNDIPAWLAQSAVPLSFYEVRTMRLNQLYVEIEPRRAFDAILHIGEPTRSVDPL